MTDLLRRPSFLEISPVFFAIFNSFWPWLCLILTAFPDALRLMMTLMALCRFFYHSLSYRPVLLLYLVCFVPRPGMFSHVHSSPWRGVLRLKHHQNLSERFPSLRGPRCWSLAPVRTSAVRSINLCWRLAKTAIGRDRMCFETFRAVDGSFLASSPPCSRGFPCCGVCASAPLIALHSPVPTPDVSFMSRDRWSSRSGLDVLSNSGVSFLTSARLGRRMPPFR